MTTTVTVSFGSVTFTGAEIISAQLIEQISPLSVEVPINVLKLTLFSSDGDFSIVNPSGFYANLQYRQPLDVNVSFDGTPVYIGLFYLDKWESKSENIAYFEAIDEIGILNDIPYLDTIVQYILNGELTIGFLIQNVLQNAFGPASGVDYEIATELYSIDAYGWLQGWTTIREHIGKLAFAGGAYITCSRSDKVQVKMMKLASELGSFDHIITSSEKHMDSPVSQKPLVSGVEVTSHNYTDPGLASEEIYRAGLNTGTYTLRLDNGPYFDVVTNVAGGSYGTDWVDVILASPNTVYVTAKKYIDSRTTHLVSNGSLPAGTRENIIKITDVPFINPAINGQSTAQRVYDYCQQRMLQKTKLFASQAKPGDTVLISSQGRWIAGIIERMETSLTGGFISNIEIVGVVYACENVLTANTTATANLTYTNCLDMFDFNLDLQDFNLTIN